MMMLRASRPRVDDSAEITRGGVVEVALLLLVLLDYAVAAFGALVFISLPRSFRTLSSFSFFVVSMVLRANSGGFVCRGSAL
jgi:hypothetical protein